MCTSFFISLYEAVFFLLFVFCIYVWLCVHVFYVWVCVCGCDFLYVLVCVSFFVWVVGCTPTHNPIHTNTYKKHIYIYANYTHIQIVTHNTRSHTHKKTLRHTAKHMRIYKHTHLLAQIDTYKHKDTHVYIVYINKLALTHIHLHTHI